LSARPLTSGEWAALSGGLAVALDRAGVSPRIEARAHPGAWIAALWRGAVPVMAVGRTVWWPRAMADFAGEPAMAILQHELQHLLDYAQGRLSPIGYLLRPRHWTYDVTLSPGLVWDSLGAEQRASLAERLWRDERSDPGGEAVRMLRSVIPWAKRT
jgi:hypothetical protein